MTGSSTPILGARPARGIPRIPPLDGLRGLAVVAVMLYHGGVPWATGGLLGVELFFVLSGFLITSLLLAERLSSGRIALGAFWARRARRLLPALLALVVVIGGYYWIQGSATDIPTLFGDGLAALFYYSNWHQIAIGSSYFAQSGPTSPFQHTWSLAIEEQFYILWPLLVLAVLAVARRRPLIQLLAVVLAMLAASATATAILFHAGSGLNRVYYGTDTRATGLLAGAALAIGLVLLRQGGHVTGALCRGGPRWRSTRSPCWPWRV